MEAVDASYPLLRIGLIGSGREAQRHLATVRTVWPQARIARLVQSTLDLPETMLVDWLRAHDVVIIAVPLVERYRVLELAIREGVHCFVDGLPTPSLKDLERLGRLAEEASVEVGVSRPWRFHPKLQADGASLGTPSLLHLQQCIGDRGVVSWHARLAEAIDLCCALARSSSVLQIDGEAVRGRSWIAAVACNVRFLSGTYAQVMLWQEAGKSSLELHLGRTGALRRLVLEPAAAASEQAEMLAFLTSLAMQQPVPVSLTEALQVLHIVERLMPRLR
jgi:hypothetical protein